jgi:uncharacterized protein YndB with AHSA1/START domain
VPNFTDTTDIPAPPEEVFAVLTDPSRSPEWQSTHSGWPDGEPGAMEPGESFRQQVTMMGMPAEVSWTVKRVESPSALELEGTGPMGTTLRTSFQVESTSDGSQLTVENELAGGALDGPMGPTVAQASQTAQQQSLEKLKGLFA